VVASLLPRSAAVCSVAATSLMDMPVEAISAQNATSTGRRGRRGSPLGDIVPLLEVILGDCDVRCASISGLKFWPAATCTSVIIKLELGG